MHRAITRRDFLHGVGVAAAGLVPGRALADAVAALEAPAVPGVGYPPALTGLRGSHVGSFEVAHELALGGRRDWGPLEEPDDSVYDLVVVGGGLSGLAAAHFYRARRPDARILILENHDDFGGHAKRNEFAMGGAQLIGHGGSQSFENPSSYSGVAKRLLRELGIDMQAFYRYFDREFYARRGMGFGTYFDREQHGVDRLVHVPLLEGSGFFRRAENAPSLEEAARQMPISETARQQFLALFRVREDRIPDVSVFREPAYLRKISYRDFLGRHLGVTEPEVYALYQDLMSSYFGVGIDASSAYNCLSMGMPGLEATGLGRFRGAIEWLASWSREPYIFHFPDGNASVARLLVRSLIPAAAPGATMEDVVEAPFDYAQLDRAESPVRLRLSSTVVRVLHQGDPTTATAVDIAYVRSGRAQRVRARACVLACYNTLIPHLCPELPIEQREALTSLVRVPLVYTNVLLSNWRAWEKLSLYAAYSPGRFHHYSMLDFPVSMGGYAFSKTPDDPIVLHMSCARSAPNRGLTARDQHRAGRRELLSMGFADYEREIRAHLAGMLGTAGFDPASDIRAITVNRWPHGYAYDYNTLFDPEVDADARPNAIGRRPFGRVRIANSDAGGLAYLDCAIDQARRAVEELEA